MLGLLLISSLSGCTLDAGQGFATLERASLEARFEPGVARDLGGRWLTDRGHVIGIERFEIEVGEVRIEELGGGSAASAFDPASPPPGYSLCHGGHCHSEDGRLVPYAEVEAELAGGSTAFSEVATLPVSRRVELRDPMRLELLEVLPSRELPETTLRRLVVDITRFELIGTVSGGTLTSQEKLEIVLQAPAIASGTLDLPIDRDGPGAFGLDVTLTIRGTLLDDIDFASTSEPRQASEASARVLEALANSAVRAHIEER